MKLSWWFYGECVLEEGDEEVREFGCVFVQNKDSTMIGETLDV